MHRIEQVALISVGRGCGFATLAIGTLMMGLSGDMAMAMKAGGILCLLVVAILYLKALHAPNHPYKRTETWIMLSPNDRPPKEVAQGMISGVLKRLYLRFAFHFTMAAGVLLLGSILFAAIRAGTSPAL